MEQKVIGLGNIKDPKDYGSVDQENSPSNDTVMKIETGRACPDGLPQILANVDHQWVQNTGWMYIMTETKFNTDYNNTSTGCQ